jgi:hypothetical protein
MQSFTKTFTAWAALCAVSLTGAAPLTSQVSKSREAAPVAKVRVAQTFTAAAAVAALKPARAPALRLVAAPTLVRKPAIAFTSDASLRARMRYETVRWGGKPVRTLDEASRILLAQAAAQAAGLHEVGLSFHDVYGVIEAETSWIPRTGSSKNGTPNLGLAQFEPRTARGLGVKDPGDPVQAVFGAALYMKEGAQWASGKLAGLKLPRAQHAAKVREGVSVYYNLSVKGRNKWNGTNSAILPVETQKHIRNTRMGAAEALQLARLLRA